MASFNRVIPMGNLTRNPELRNTRSQSSTVVEDELVGSGSDIPI